MSSWRLSTAIEGGCSEPPTGVLDESYRIAWGDLIYVKENLVEILLISLIWPLLYLLAFGFGLASSMS